MVCSCCLPDDSILLLDDRGALWRATVSLSGCLIFVSDNARSNCSYTPAGELRVQFFEDCGSPGLASCHALPMLSIRVSEGERWSLDTHRVWIFAAAEAGNHVLYELRSGCQSVAIGEYHGRDERLLLFCSQHSHTLTNDSQRLRHGDCAGCEYSRTRTCDDGGSPARHSCSSGGPRLRRPRIWFESIMCPASDNLCHHAMFVSHLQLPRTQERESPWSPVAS